MKKLIFISGSGKSGSTLLDIIIGSQLNSFSIGELHNLFRPGLIENEYCTCGKIVNDCELWNEVIKRWRQNSLMNQKDYYKYQQFFRTNKNYKSLLRELKNPSDLFLTYLKDTKLLYNIISEVSKCDVLIDSSKSITRALILNKIYSEDKLVIIHLLNKFSRVLNSNKKVVEKDLKIGREKSTNKKGLEYVFYFLPRWLIPNLILYFQLRSQRKVIVFEEYIFNPNKVLEKIYNNSFTQMNEYIPKHLMAGNHMRMKKSIKIDKEILNKPLTNLNFVDRIIGKIVDSIFYKFLK